MSSRNADTATRADVRFAAPSTRSRANDCEVGMPGCTLILRGEEGRFHADVSVPGRRRVCGHARGGVESRAALAEAHFEQVADCVRLRGRLVGRAAGGGRCPPPDGRRRRGNESRVFTGRRDAVFHRGVRRQYRRLHRTRSWWHTQAADLAPVAGPGARVVAGRQEDTVRVNARELRRPAGDVHHRCQRRVPGKAAAAVGI